MTRFALLFLLALSPACRPQPPAVVAVPGEWWSDADLQAWIAGMPADGKERT